MNGLQHFVRWGAARFKHLCSRAKLAPTQSGVRSARHGSPAWAGLLRLLAWPTFDVADGQKHALPKRANASTA
eukprot:7924904-Alexandrium_andersonii.AAC.1